MRFRFIHAADLHLGSPFVGLASNDQEIAKRFSSACREALSELVSQCIDMQVSFLVIAGDVYDGDWKDTSIGLFFNREVAHLERANIPVYLVKGNHDAESVITKAVSLPKCVNEFPSSKPKTFRIEELKVALHGRSFPNRAVTDNYAISYPDPVPGWFNIGVLHTSCNGRPNHDSYAPCGLDQLIQREYQYWALGHVHEFEKVAQDPWVVFPGNLQGRSIKECGAKGAVVVEVNDGEVQSVERVLVDKARWVIVDVNLDGIDGQRDAFDVVEERAREAVSDDFGKLLACRVRLFGRSELHNYLNANRKDVHDEIQATLHRIYEDAWLQDVQICTTEKSIAAQPSFSMLQSLDIERLITQVQSDPAFKVAVKNELDAIRSKFPGGVESQAPSEQDLDSLIAQARATVLGRTKS